MGGSNPSWKPKIPGSDSGFCHCVVLWLRTSICELKQLHFMIPKCPAGSLLLGFQTKYLELTPYGRVLARSKWSQDMPGILGRETSKGCKDRRTFWRWWGIQEDLLSYRWWGMSLALNSGTSGQRRECPRHLQTQPARNSTSIPKPEEFPTPLNSLLSGFHFWWTPHFTRKFNKDIWIWRKTFRITNYYLHTIPLLPGRVKNWY